MSTPENEICLEKYTDEQSGWGLAGFFLLGALLSLLGSLLIVWQYHMIGDGLQAGLHFLALDLGFALASLLCSRLAVRVSVRALGVTASLLAASALGCLPLVGPPAPFGWRFLTIAILGVSAGMIASTLLRRLESCYQRASRLEWRRDSLLLSTGALAITALVGLFYAKGNAGWEIAGVALLPLGTLVSVLRTKPAMRPRPNLDKPPIQPRNLRALATTILGFLLFCQLSNELAIAGWLPTLLVRRLGIDPVTAMSLLATYFLFVAFGRWAAKPALQLMGSRRLLLASVAIAMAGYLMLATTHTMLAASASIVLIGFGFGPIFPLLGENLDGPVVLFGGLRNGAFSIAITGALAIPWLLGYVFEYLGNNYLLLVPAFGSVAVFLLTLLLMLESRVMRGNTPVRRGQLLY